MIKNRLTWSFSFIVLIAERVEAKLGIAAINIKCFDVEEIWASSKYYYFLVICYDFIKLPANSVLSYLRRLLEKEQDLALLPLLILMMAVLTLHEMSFLEDPSDPIIERLTASFYLADLDLPERD